MLALAFSTARSLVLLGSDYDMRHALRRDLMAVKPLDLTMLGSFKIGSIVTFKESFQWLAFRFNQSPKHPRA